LHFLRLKDLYEFKDWFAKAGFVNDLQMFLLNHYGMAQYFRVKDSHDIEITWPKGYRLEYDDEMAVINGNIKPFPQYK